MSSEVFRARDVKAAIDEKTFLRGLNLKLYKGETLGVFGTFDSGKTTLLDLITGKVSPASGTIFFNGKKLEHSLFRIDNRPIIARIGKESTLVNGLSLWENILILRGYNANVRFVNPLLMKKSIATAFNEYNIDLDPKEKAGSLDLFHHVLLEMLKARLKKAQIILIDDFSMECSYQETQKLYNLMARLKSEGISFLITSCHLELLKTYSDRLDFLSNGRMIMSFNNTPGNYTDIEKILESLFPEVKSNDNIKKTEEAPAVLSLDKVDVGLQEPVSLKLHKGEIASFVDPSQSVLTALREKIFGNNLLGNSQILFDINGKKSFSIRNAKNLVVFIDPFDFSTIIKEMSPADNICIGLRWKFSSFGVIKKKLIKCMLDEFSEWYENDEIAFMNDCRTLTKKDKMALMLYRVKLMNPAVVICRDPVSVSDIVTCRMLQNSLKVFSKNGSSVCIFLSNIEKIEDNSDKYFVATKKRLLSNVKFENIKDLLEWN